KYLVVTREKRVLVDGIVAAVDRRIEGRGSNYYACVHRGNAVVGMQFNFVSLGSSFKHMFLVNHVLASPLERDSRSRGLERERPLCVGLRFNIACAEASSNRGSRHHLILLIQNHSGD